MKEENGKKKEEEEKGGAIDELRMRGRDREEQEKVEFKRDHFRMFLLYLYLCYLLGGSSISHDAAGQVPSLAARAASMSQRPFASTSAVQSLQGQTEKAAQATASAPVHAKVPSSSTRPPSVTRPAICAAPDTQAVHVVWPTTLTPAIVKQASNEEVCVPHSSSCPETKVTNTERNSTKIDRDGVKRVMVR